MSMIIILGAGEPPDPGHIVNAVAFDGSSDYLTRGGGLSGVSDSKKVSFSFWIKALDNGTGRVIYGGAGSGSDDTFFQINKNSGGSLSVSASVGGDVILSKSFVPAGITEANGWRHVCGCFDLALAGSAQLVYANDAAVGFAATVINQNMDLTLPNWSVGGAPEGNVLLNAEIAQFWFAPGVYIDFSDTTSRRKFISENKRPVDLGSDGSTPTGSKPAIFLDGATASWHTNKGSGGGFTENGALTDATSTPND